MKTHLLAATSAMLLLSANAHADTILGVYAGAQGWNMGTSGGFAKSNSLTEFDFDSEGKGTFYVALEHPLPLIPNIKVARSDLGTQGKATLTNNFTFGGEIFAVNTQLNNQVVLDTTDVTLYYEILDNDLVSFDIGLTAKIVDGTLTVEEQGGQGQLAKEEFSGELPMLYSRVEFSIPATNFGAYAEAHFLSIDDHTLTDYQAALTYDVLDNIAVDLSLQLGYRAVSLELDDLDGIYTDMDFSGGFLGLEVHF